MKSRQQKSSGRNDEEMVALHGQTLFSSSCMPLKMSSEVKFFTAMRMVTARNPMIAIRNAHAFGPSSTVANMKTKTKSTLIETTRSLPYMQGLSKERETRTQDGECRLEPEKMELQ